MSQPCQRCNRTPVLRGRRFRCGGPCNRLVCSRCCNRGGAGQGQNSVRWAECYDCQHTREASLPKEATVDRERRLSHDREVRRQRRERTTT